MSGPAAGACHGNGPTHCCYVDGEPCRWLEEGTVAGRRWVCGLRRELGSWDAVHDDPRYAPVQAAWDRLNEAAGEVLIPSCGEWGPGTGQCCYAWDASVSAVAVK